MGFALLTSYFILHTVFLSAGATRPDLQNFLATPKRETLVGMAQDNDFKKFLVYVLQIFHQKMYPCSRSSASLYAVLHFQPAFPAV